MGGQIYMLNLIDGCCDIFLVIWSVVILGFLVGKF